MAIKILRSTCYNHNLTYLVSIRSYCKSSLRSRDQFVILKEKLADHATHFSRTMFDRIKKDVIAAGNRVNSYNFDSVFMEACIQNNMLDVGKDFFLESLKTNGELNLALVRKFFRICYLSKDKCDEGDKKLLLSLYDKIMKDYPLLDDISYEGVVMGLSITARWREGLQLLNLSKQTGEPTNQLYGAIISAAFYNGDEELGWQLFEEMLNAERKPHWSIYSTMIHKKSDSSVFKLFKMLERHGLNIAPEIASILMEYKGGKITNISNKGVCQNCRNKLASIEISQYEFKELTDDFLNPVLIGKDIFIKTKPSELENFKQFLNSSPRVDIVLDGLNIAYSGSKKNYSSYSISKMLLNVLKHFLKSNLKVMILGRRHMKSWNRSHMNFIKDNSFLFLAEDLSSDDPFLLYATMFYGLGTKFVSRDLMRGHKFLLRTPQMKALFSKWQQKHQLFLGYVEKNGFVHLNDVSSYLFSAQCKGCTWHIPIYEPNEPGVQPHIQALNSKWLCISLDQNP